MKIICVGHAAWDITIPISKFPLENTKNRYNDVVEGFGGPALSAAYLLGKWGLEPYYIGTLGNDTHGKSILASLNSIKYHRQSLSIMRASAVFMESFTLIDNGL